MHFNRSFVFILALIIISCDSPDEEKVDANDNSEVQEQCVEEASFNPDEIANSIANEFDRDVHRSHERSEETGREIFEMGIPTNTPIEAIKPSFELWEISNTQVELLSDWEYDEFSDGYDATYVYKEICEGDLGVEIGMIGVGYSPSLGLIELWINEL